MALIECPLWRKRDNMCQILFKANGLKGAWQCDNQSHDPKCERRMKMHENWKLAPAPAPVEVHIASGKSAQVIAREELISGCATRDVRRTVIQETPSRIREEHKSMDDVLSDAIQKKVK